MATTSQLFLLADHIKLSLLERQRAISLDIENRGGDRGISSSLASFRDGLESLERVGTRVSDEQVDQLERLRSLYEDLYHQFNKTDGSSNESNGSRHHADPYTDYTGGLQASSLGNGGAINEHRDSTKAVRFRDEPEDENRVALLPYRDEPEAPDHSQMNNQQIHTYHSRVLREQDEQLGHLGRSVGRQHELSIEIGNELDDQNQMLDDVDEHVGRHQQQIDRARNRVSSIARKAKDNLQLTIIFVLVIVLVLLLVLLR